MRINEMDLIHYGSSSFDVGKIRPIINIGREKPAGGLWTSPTSSKYGWADWCIDAEYYDCSKKDSFIVQLKSNSRVCIIDSLEDLLELPLIGEFKDKLDFELLATMCDAIWLTEQGQKETHLSYPVNLYGWDCESVLIMNPKCIS